MREAARASEGRNGLTGLFTLAQWLPSYDIESLRADVVAGLTVAVMLIPQGMAYALLLGVPPIYGLYASLVPLLLYPIFGTAMHVAVGVVAIDMLIAGAGLRTVAEPGTDVFVTYALLLAAFVGLIQLGLGAARLGFVANLLSKPVVAGFTSGAALLIALSQISPLVGLDTYANGPLASLGELTARIGEVHVAPAALGVGVALLLMTLPRWRPNLPAPLIALVLATVAVWAFGLEDVGVPVLGEVPSGLPGFSPVAVDVPILRALGPTALMLALVQLMTITSLGRTFGTRFRYSVEPNRELIGLGTANLVGPFFGALPVSASFSRSAVNVHAGARSPLSNVYAAAVVALTLLVLTPVLRLVPLPALAALILVAALRLMDVEQIRFLRHVRRSEGAVALVTFGGTLLIGIVEGILLGLAASLAAFLYRTGRPNTAVLGHLPGTRSFRDVDREDRAEALEGILILRVDASFSFLNAAYLKDLIFDRVSDPEHGARAVIIDAAAIIDLDSTAADVLRTVHDTLEERAIPLYVAGAKGPVRDVMERAGLRDLIGERQFFRSPHRAVRHILEGWGEQAAYLERVPGEDVWADG